MASLLKQTRGSAIFESLSVMSVLPILIGAALSACYVSFARVWIERESYEAVVCLGSLAQTNDCEKELRRGIKRALPFGQLSRLLVTRSPNRANVEVTFALFDRPIADLKTTRGLPLANRVVDRGAR